MKVRSVLGRTLKALALIAGVLIVIVVAFFLLKGDDLIYESIAGRGGDLVYEGRTTELTSEEFLADAEELVSALGKRHVSFDEVFDGDRMRTRAQEIAESADTDLDYRLGLLELVGMGGRGSGHTMIIPLQRHLRFRVYPFLAWEFDDGVFITSGIGSMADEVGSKLVTVGDEPVEGVIDRLERYASGDNAHSTRANAVRLLGIAEPLIGLGSADPDGRVILGLERPDGSTADVEAGPSSLGSITGLRIGRQMQQRVPAHWSPADIRPRQHPWTISARDGITWVHVDEMRETEGRSIASLLEAIGQAVGSPQFERLVIDLRSNGGGNNRLSKRLASGIAELPELRKPGTLWAVIGPRTFSAAGNLAYELERLTSATFAGEPTGASPIQYGDSAPLGLTESGVIVRVASRLWADDLPGSRRDALLPDVPVSLRSGAHFEDSDPIVEAIKTKQPAPRTGISVEELEGTWKVTPLHRLRVLTGELGSRVEIDSNGPFFRSPLLAAGKGKYQTRREGIALETSPAPVLIWHGARFPLERMDEGWELPFETIETIHTESLEDAYTAVERQIDSDHEFLLNREAYRALESGDHDRSIAIFELQTRLFPKVANSWDSLGDGLAAAGRTSEAIHAYQTALEYDPTFSHARTRLSELEKR